MSIFSAVDEADRPDRALAYLDVTARSEAGMKHYAAAVHALRRPDGFVLDVGCGAGHDLELLADVDLSPLGADPSAVLLEAARERTAWRRTPLVRANGEALPFRDASVAAARIERVLMHVADPAVVLSETVRVLAPGALLTVFEPDWDSFIVRGPLGDECAAWLAPVRHPGVGGDLWDLVERAGCVVLDKVEEQSVWRSLDVLHRVFDLHAALDRAVTAGRISAETARRWLRDQEEREARHAFWSTIRKVLLVACKQ
jgi:SAM-dependent methyltransferase